jgi:hypothetical protein
MRVEEGMKGIASLENLLNVGLAMMLAKFRLLGRQDRQGSQRAILNNR